MKGANEGKLKNDLPPPSSGLHSFSPPRSEIHRWSRGLRRCHSRSTEPVILWSTFNSIKSCYKLFSFATLSTYFAVNHEILHVISKNSGTTFFFHMDNNQLIIIEPTALTFMFLCMSPLHREMSGTVKGFHAGSKVFLMTYRKKRQEQIWNTFNDKSSSTLYKIEGHWRYKGRFYRSQFHVMKKC